MAQLKQTLAETCFEFYNQWTKSIREAHKEDLTNLANQLEARDGYQRAIKQMVRQNLVAVLHNDIKAQIRAKLQSLDTKEKRASVRMIYLQHDTTRGPRHLAPSQWHT